MSGKYRLWGVDGQLRGNEHRLFLMPPVMVDSHGAYRIARDPRWDAEHHLSEPIDADMIETLATSLHVGDDLAVVRPGAYVALAGPEWQKRARDPEMPPIAKMLDTSIEWHPTPSGFHWAVLSGAEFARVSEHLCTTVLRYFDKELRAMGGQSATSRLLKLDQLLSTCPAIDVEARLLRGLLVSKAHGDTRQFDRSLALAAVRLRMPPEAVLDKLGELHDLILSTNEDIDGAADAEQELYFVVSIYKQVVLTGDDFVRLNTLVKQHSDNARFAIVDASTRDKPRLESLIKHGKGVNESFDVWNRFIQALLITVRASQHQGDPTIDRKLASGLEKLAQQGVDAAFVQRIGVALNQRDAAIICLVNARGREAARDGTFDGIFDTPWRRDQQTPAATI